MSIVGYSIMCEAGVILHDEVMLTWIIPVYNGEKYIQQAIESVLRQPCKDFEIIVVDDGSKDATAAIVKSFLSRDIRLIHKENGGVSSARNLGIREARGKYLAFLDADDIICIDAYTKEIHSYLEEDKFDLFSFNYFTGDQHLRHGNRVTVVEGEVNRNILQMDPFKHCSSFIFHRKIFEGEHAVNFPEGIKIREDVAFLFLVYQRIDRALCIAQNWFVYRNNSTSVLHQNHSYDFLIHHAIPAWQWCKNQCDCLDAKHHCDIRIFAEAASYIRLSCMSGVPICKIKNVLTMPEVEDALSNYDILWDSSKKEYDAFIATPNKYWKKRRIWGICVNILKRLGQVPFFRLIYFRWKYKENIRNFV